MTATADHAQRKRFEWIKVDEEPAVLPEITFYSFAEHVDHWARRESFQSNLLRNVVITEI